MASRRMCVLVALMLLASSTAALICAKAEDTGATGVTLMATQPGDMDEAYDICWAPDYSYAVVVGAGNGDTGRWQYVPSTGAWNILDDYGGSTMYAVDYDQWTGNYIMVGSYWSPSVYVGLYWSDYSIPVPSPGLGFRDVAVFDQNRFVTISENGHAYYYWFSGSWFYTEIMGALPDPSAILHSVLYDPFAGTIELLGGDAGGHGKAYRIYVGDLNNGYYYAYADDPPSNYNTFYAADKSNAAGYSLLVGQGQVTKLYQSSGGYVWAREPMMPCAKPAVRREPVMVYDPNTMKMIMFGGYSETGNTLEDTWEYDIFRRTWTQYFPVPSPSGRRGHAMVWDQGNGYALMFGGWNSSVGGLQDTWSYDPTAHAWTQRSATFPSGTLYYHAMYYDYWYNEPVVYGGYQAGARTYMAHWTGANWISITPSGSPPPAYYHAMAYDWNSARAVLFGGLGTGGQESATYTFDPSTSIWTQRAPIVSPPPRSQHSMAYGWGWGRAMLFGGYYSGTCYNDIWSFNEGANTWMEDAGGCAELRQTAMAFDFMNNMFVFGGANPADDLNNDIYTWGRYIDTTGTGMIFNNTNYTWRDVDWYPVASNPSAVIVGSGGNISYHIGGTSRIIPIENKVTSSILFTVACKPPQSPAYAIAMGGGGGGGVKINQDVFTSSTVTVNAEVPHVAYMYINDSANQPMNNGKINVDSGTYNTFYTIEAELYYQQGRANFTNIELWGWRDNGSLYGDAPAMLGAGFDTAGYENVRFHYNYSAQSNGWTQIYPNHGGEMESQMWFGNCFYTPINTTSARITFCFYPLKQFRAASGPTIWSEPAGNRYASGVLNGQESLSALNDPFTWNIKMRINTTDGTNNSAYDEFGVYKYTYIGASDVPATISGSGPPGGTVYLAPEQNVTFVSNCNYTFKVYLDGLLRGVNDANRTMPASALGVMGGDLENWTIPGTQAHFNGTGSANALFLFGANGSYVQPRAYYTTTHTGYGTIGTVRWRCIIPMGTAEDRYTTTVTFMLEHD